MAGFPLSDNKGYEGLRDDYCGQCSCSSDEWQAVGSSTNTTPFVLLIWVM